MCIGGGGDLKARHLEKSHVSVTTVLIGELCAASPLILIGGAVRESSRWTTGSVYPAEGGVRGVPRLHRGSPIEEPRQLRRGFSPVRGVHCAVFMNETKYWLAMVPLRSSRSGFTVAITFSSLSLMRI